MTRTAERLARAEAAARRQAAWAAAREYPEHLAPLELFGELNAKVRELCERYIPDPVMFKAFVGELVAVMGPAIKAVDDKIREGDHAEKR